MTQHTAYNNNYVLTCGQYLEPADKNITTENIISNILW